MLLLLSLLAAAPTPAEAAFTQLKGIAGNWEAEVKPGRVLKVSYALTAADSVLVETWTTPSGGTTMTVFHLDGARLLATHYCAQGNQPRLAWKPGKGRLLGFAFADATNLASPAQSHLHRLEIGLVDGQLQRREVYVEKGKEDASEVRFTRR